MKKSLCILFSVVLTITSAFYITAVASQINTSEISAEKFATEVGSMIKISDETIGLPGKNTSDENSEFKTARLIVKCKNKINILNAVSVVSGFDDLWVLQFSSATDAENAYNYYLNQDEIEFVEVDKEINALLSSTNSYPYNTVSENKDYLSWGPQHIGIDVLNNRLTENNVELSKTVVAVVDTGVDSEHPFLDGRILPTRINTSSSGTRNSSMDDNGHGTQVAGVIADSTLDNVYIKPYKVLDSRGSGTLISLAAGINCAVSDEVDIINISVGFEEESDVLKAAIDNAEMNNILVIGAAGNDGTDSLYYPASYDNVVKVTAINESNIITNFSTYGNGVDFAAPGIKIKTTTLNGGFTSIRGTSIAAPFVSSIAATIKAFLPDTSTEDILAIMSDEAVLVNEHNPELKYGNGVIRAPQSPIESTTKEKTLSPYFSHETAFSQKELDIQIFCDTPDAVIYYTTDRSVPSKSNPTAKIYDGVPIHAAQTITILAVAYCEGKYRSSVSSFATIIAPLAEDHTFKVNFNGTLTSYNGNNTSLTIPETVNGIKITSIGANAFAGKNITEIILPDTVTSIGAHAFENCENLKTIFGRNVVNVEEYAFNNCVWIKNLFLFSSLENIGKYSFANVSSKQNLITGATFKLNLKKITSIPEGCFTNSAISELKLETISSIGNKAFLQCNQLVNVNINNVSNIPEGCFKGCESLTDVEIHNLTYVPSALFSSCENLISINIPDARSVNSNAFESCVSLLDVKLPSAKTIYSNAFNGCVNLRVLDLPSFMEFESDLYNKKGLYPQFPSNLETFYASEMEKTVPDMFKTAPDITYIRLNSATDLSANTFRGCHKIYSLNIENIQKISPETFNDCTITFIDARNLITTADMPDNSGILLSNNFLESTDKADNLTVYGTAGTFVERYSKLKGYKFIEIPLIYKPVPEYITENSETVYITAVGFDLSYQWYWNTKPETFGGTPINGASTMSYTFTENDTAPYYYCEITQNDLGTISKITTNIITKDTVPADYTAYNEAVKKADELNKEIYVSTSELDNALSVDVSNRYSCEQNFVDKQTKAIYDAIANLKLKKIETVDVYASETKLTLFDETKIITVLNPKDVEYKKIEYNSSDEKVVVVFANGYVWCVGSGTADVTVTVTNLDNSVAEGKITFQSNLSFFEDFIGSLLRSFFIVGGRISKLFNYS